MQKSVCDHENGFHLQHQQIISTNLFQFKKKRSTAFCFLRGITTGLYSVCRSLCQQIEEGGNELEGENGFGVPAPHFESMGREYKELYPMCKGSRFPIPKSKVKLYPLNNIYTTEESRFQGSIAEERCTWLLAQRTFAHLSKKINYRFLRNKRPGSFRIKVLIMLCFAGFS